MEGLKSLIAFQPSPYVSQLVGSCKDKFAMQYYENGCANNLTKALERGIKDNVVENSDNKAKLGMQLCINYAEIIRFLHSSPRGTRVNCDSNTLYRTLHNMLITDDVTLVLNDLDILPEAQGKNVLCTHWKLNAEQTAPEMRWPYLNKTYHWRDQPTYDEKSDIWRIAGVCEHFVSLVTNGSFPMQLLEDIHKKCQTVDPDKRPTAQEVLEEYSKVMRFLKVY